MWRNLALNIKLSVVLVALQASILLAVFLWLSHWLQGSRMEELRHRLDTQSDVIESLIQPSGELLLYQRDAEFASELDHDQNLYFALNDAITGEPLFDSEGPPPALRNQLRGGMARGLAEDDKPSLLSVGHDHWLAQKVRLERGPPGAVHTVTLSVAVNAQPVLDAIDEVNRLVALAALGILLLTGVGSFFVVAISTRNLRDFAHQLRDLKPPEFTRQVLYQPQSAEEKLLFDSYAHMERSVHSVLESHRLFIANASHELKTPIAAVTAALEVILAKPRSTEDYAQTCRDVLAEMQVLKRLSLGLLDLARLDSTLSSATLSTPLASSLDQAYSRWQKAAQAKNIRLCLTPLETPGTQVPGAPEQWETLLGNLLDNAIKYSDAGSEVCLSAALMDEQQVRIHVIDEGIGMSPDELVQLGDVFFRADTARAQGLSFGLGFAYCQRIIQQLGGALAVTSEQGVGTRVTLTVRHR